MYNRAIRECYDFINFASRGIVYKFLFDEKTVEGRELVEILQVIGARYRGYVIYVVGINGFNTGVFKIFTY